MRVRVCQLLPDTGVAQPLTHRAREREKEKEKTLIIIIIIMVCTSGKQLGVSGNCKETRQVIHIVWPRLAQ